MKVIIAGSRTITDPLAVFTAVATSPFNGKITEIVSGCAKGVDKLGERFAVTQGIPVARFPADWSTHGRSAGIYRNNRMAEYADALIAVWDGVSRGTQHMIGVMGTVHKKPVYVFRVDKKEEQTK